MSGPPADVAAVRLAVRRALAPLPAGGCVLVAVSGGADSLALLDATAWAAPRRGLRAGAVTVDHGLQPGSADRARRLATGLVRRGLDPVEVVHVAAAPGRGGGGPEAAARTARYAALEAAAGRHGALVLLGHTADDQAETVLIGLARGSGGRSLAGMAAARGCFRRPLLQLSRACVRGSLDAGRAVWEDPHNGDRRFTRARVRADALPALDRALGPGAAAALARTADLLREDADALDGWAAAAHAAARRPEPPAGLDVEQLAELPTAVRRRVLRSAAVEAGCPPGSLARGHVLAVDALITAWHGQAGVDLPGRVRASRTAGAVRFGSTGGERE